MVVMTHTDPRGQLIILEINKSYCTGHKSGKNKKHRTKVLSLSFISFILKGFLFL